MPLEDFFTLTEMKDGLSTLGRVEELVSMMQKERDCVLNNADDAARQWSAIARTLAATENKDCLDHFVQLNGLCYLNQCLQEAQKCNKVVSDSVLEGSITSLLATFERLPIDREKMTVSGIGVTVEQLLGHKNIKIKEKAKVLSDKWNDTRINVVGCDSSEDKGPCLNDLPKLPADANSTEDGELSKNPVCGTPPSKVGTGEASCEVESAGTGSQHSNVTRCSESSQVDTAKDGKICVSDHIKPTTSSNAGGADAALRDATSLASSIVSDSCLENLSLVEESSVCLAEGLASAVTCSSPVCKGKDVDDQRDVLVLKKVFDGAEGMEVDVNMKEDNTYRSNRKETCNMSSSSGLSASLPAEKVAVEPTVSCDFDSKGGESCISNTRETQANSGADESGMPKSLRTTEELRPVANVTLFFQDMSSNGCIRRKSDSPETSHQGKEAVGSVSDTKEAAEDVDLNVSKGVDIVIRGDSSKAVGTKGIGKMDQKSELGLEYEEIDALEVARLVAIEVEREVVDYREAFCSSPEVVSGETTSTCSHGFVEGKQDQQVMEVDGNRLPTKKELSDASSPKEHQSRISDNIGTDPEEHEHVLESPKVSAIAQGSVGKFDKSRCDFDLNDDLFTEEFSCSINPIHISPVNLSAPIAVVAASKGAPSLPISPLQFEGEMGWKGSAATSAFRPASPRRTPDCEKTCSDRKQKTNWLEIDLNVAESEHDVVVDPTPVKQMPVSCSLPSGDSSMEVSSRIAERLKLDLNRLGDDDILTNPSPSWKLHHQNGDQNLSSASSSSSRQPSMRDFDLNDNPCFLDAGGSYKLDKSTSKTSTVYGISKLDDPVMKIMGSRMAVERKEYDVNQSHHSFLGNGLDTEAMLAARPPLHYGHMLPPPYGYHGHPGGPMMSIPPSLYGHGSFPYMVDSRGTPIIPQVLGSAGLNGAPYARPPFLMNANGATSGLDLNSGMMASMEAGAREGGSFKQLFTHRNNGVAEEQARISSQPSSSGMAMKRKEPDCGWEPYAALGYNR